MGHKYQLYSRFSAKGAPPIDASYVHQSSHSGEMFHCGVLFDNSTVYQDKQELRNLYECPVYKTRERGNKLVGDFSNRLRILIISGQTYIWTFNLRTREKPSKWVLAGVALLLQI